MKKTLLAALAVVCMIGSFCCGATVAYAQELQLRSQFGAEDLTPDPGQPTISPEVAAKARATVRKLREDVSGGRVTAEQGKVLASSVAEVLVRLGRVEKQLEMASRNQWRVSGSKLYTCVEKLYRCLWVSVDMAHYEGVKTRALASEARERAELAQGEAFGAMQGVRGLNDRVNRVAETAETALRLASTPPPPVPQTVFATASAFTGWSSEMVFGLGVGIEAPYAKFDTRVSTNLGDYREVDALAALRTTTSAAWFNPYGGLHYVGVFKDGFGAGITDNRVGPGIGNDIKVTEASAIDIRLTADIGGESTVVAVTAGYQHSF